jgi:hypothetical protein
MVWHLDVGFSNIKKKDSYKWECSSHTLGTWAGFKTMEISLVYIFNTTIQGKHWSTWKCKKMFAQYARTGRQIAIADISYLVVSLQR